MFLPAAEICLPNDEYDQSQGDNYGDRDDTAKCAARESLARRATCIINSCSGCAWSGSNEDYRLRCGLRGAGSWSRGSGATRGWGG